MQATAARGYRDWFLLVLAIVPPLLVLPNLDASILWQDEAETALLARSIALHGYPLADAGPNVITDQPGRIDLNDAGIWIWTPWLQNYFVAGSFLLLGESTWSARLPFALAGWAVFVLSYAVFLSLSGDRALSRLAVTVLMLSVPFLLHARQGRYYMLLALFNLLYVWGYHRLVRGQRGSIPLFSAAGVFLYYSFFPQLFASTAAVFAHLLLWHRHRPALLRFGWCCAWIALFTLPFFVFTGSWSRDYEGEGYGAESLARYIATLRAYTAQIHAYCWPFVLTVPLAWLGVGPGGNRLPAATLLTVGMAALFWSLCSSATPLSFGVFAVVVAIGVGAAISWMTRERAMSGGDEWGLVALVLLATVAVGAAFCPFPFFRYLIGVFPFFALVTAWTVLRLSRRRWWALLALAGMVIVTDALHYLPLHKSTMWVMPRTPKPGMALLDTRYGHAHTNGVTIAVLLKDGRGAGEVEIPLLNLHRELTADYRGPTESVIQHLGAHARPGDTIAVGYEHFPFMFYTDLRVYQDHQTEGLAELPDWLFVHSLEPPKWSEPIRRALASGRYVRQPVDAYEIPWDNVPEPYWHRFETPRAGKKVELFRLSEPTRSDSRPRTD
jgi:hypothetical protein